MNSTIHHKGESTQQNGGTINLYSELKKYLKKYTEYLRI